MRFFDDFALSWGDLRGVLDEGGHGLKWGVEGFVGGEKRVDGCIAERRERR